jgi:pullulanase
MVEVRLYKEGYGDALINEIPMKKDEKGTWVLTVEEEIEGFYYTYLITRDNELYEVVDPYAKATGVNGMRGMVVNLDRTNPEGWEKDDKPEFNQLTDAIIYELHVRDLSSDSNSGIQNVGKYLGLIECGTKSKEGQSTGLDHIKELGITHLHLLPIYDYATVDETRLSEKQFNWGYDPKNYNVPEGSYATDPYTGEVRIKELKKMILELHNNNIRVVMDVVYNHTYESEHSDFNKIEPNYYYRQDANGFTNGSGCGNEIASERKMVRKYIVDSIKYWAKEYHIDGFRFDLMGVLDIDTMNEIRREVDKIDPSIILYGEGWNGGESALKEEERATIANAERLDSIALFNDRIRDGIKGSVFEEDECGFVNGAPDLEEIIQCGVVGSILHPQISSKYPWAVKPTQSINYVSAHDNLTLWDKLVLSTPLKSMDDRIRMNKLAAAICLTSQGIPFFQAGEEFLRSKEKEDGTFDENSYKSDDSINGIKWINKHKYNDVYQYYRGLIALRKRQPELRMTTAKEVREKIKFMEPLEKNVVAYTIDDQKEKVSMVIIYNANDNAVTLKLPEGTWNVYVNDKRAGVEVIEEITNNEITVNKISAMVLVRA